MKRTFILILFALTLLSGINAQGYKVGDKADDFNLKNVDGKFVSMRNYPEAKGFVVIFTCNHCPFAKAYQDRIIEINKKYKPLGYPVIAVNPNDPSIEPEDSFDNMVALSARKNFGFLYLFDEKQDIYRKYGARKTPHVFLLQKSGNDLVVKYIGAIDDNSQDASKVSNPWLANAIDSILKGSDPDPSSTKAIGCSIKDARPMTP
jgi:peroxiredoxin